MVSRLPESPRRGKAAGNIFKSGNMPALSPESRTTRAFPPGGVRLAKELVMQSVSLPKAILTVGGLAMVAYHAVASQYLYFSQWEHQTIHFAFLFLMVFMSFIVKAKNRAARAGLCLCLLAALACCAYVYGNIEELEMSQGFPTTAALGVGIFLMLATALGSWLSWGLPLLLVALTFVAYFFLGHLLSGPLYHPAFDFDYVVSMLSVGLSGLYGLFMSISADQVFMFVVFGSLLGIFKVEGLLMEAGKILGRRLRGGAGLTAVFSNSLIGMVSGAPVANVAITGPFVLPYMKKSGYSVDEAGGVLACSATGSQLMPPVMGAAAFMMATFIGQPYAVVMLAGILPAVLFYFAVTLGVQFLSVRKDLRTVRLDVDWALIRRRLPVFALPIGLIFVMLLMRYSPANTAFWAGVITLATGFAIKDTRPTCKELINSLVSGAVTGAKIGISLALIGMVAQTLISTGLGGKLASLIHTLAGGQLLPALLVTMVVALILGCAVPPAAAYALCAIIIIPTLTPMGVDLLRAHMFCFYFSIIAAVTPPVGLASLAATGISGGHYGVTSVHGFRLSLSGFVLPFLIIYNPLFSYDFSNAVWSVCSLICILTGLTALNALLYGAMARPFKAHDYALSGVVMLLSLWLTACGGSLTPATVIAGTAVAVALLLFQWRRQAAQPLTVARSDDAHGTKA